MILYRLTLVSHSRKSYAARSGTLAGEPVVAWVQRRASATLFSKAEAAKLSRRMKRIRIRTKLEKA